MNVKIFWIKKQNILDQKKVKYEKLEAYHKAYHQKSFGTEKYSAVSKIKIEIVDVNSFVKTQ